MMRHRAYRQTLRRGEPSTEAYLEEQRAQALPDDDPEDWEDSAPMATYQPFTCYPYQAPAVVLTSSVTDWADGPVQLIIPAGALTVDYEVLGYFFSSPSGTASVQGEVAFYTQGISETAGSGLPLGILIVSSVAYVPFGRFPVNGAEPAGRDHLDRAFQLSAGAGVWGSYATNGSGSQTIGVKLLLRPSDYA